MDSFNQQTCGCEGCPFPENTKSVSYPKVEILAFPNFGYSHSLLDCEMNQHSGREQGQVNQGRYQFPEMRYRKTWDGPIV